MEDYLNFEEAVKFLSTTKSTLYKWLKAEKVPAHKLGRQWRFKEEELRAYIEGDRRTNNGLDALEKFLRGQKEKSIKEGNKMTTLIEDRTNEIAEALLWDAIECGAYAINIQPEKDSYKVSYRGAHIDHKIPKIDMKTFEALDEFFIEISNSYGGENRRRFFINNDSEENRIDLQVQYVAMETVLGKRLNLKLMRSDILATNIDRIASGDDLTALRNLFQHNHGIVVLSGSAGSGKTTTLYCGLMEKLKEGNLVFTLESPVSFILDGVNQIEVDDKDLMALDKAVTNIYDSDPDVVCFLLDSNENIEIKLQYASKFANSGHLVLLQLGLGDNSEVLKLLSTHLNIDAQRIVRGIVSQKLVPNSTGIGRKAHYQILSNPFSSC